MLHSRSVFYSHIHVSPFNPKTCLSFWEIFLHYFFGHFLPRPSPVFSCSIFPERCSVSLLLTANRERRGHCTGALSLLQDVWVSAARPASKVARSHSRQEAAARMMRFPPQGCSRVLMTWQLASLRKSDPRHQGRSSNVFYDLPSKVTCCHSAVWLPTSQPYLLKEEITRTHYMEAKVSVGHLGSGYPRDILY